MEVEMKFGTRLVLYYSLTSMIVLLIVGIFVLKSIEAYWIDTVDQQLIEQNNTVQDYIKQVFLFEKQKSDKLNEENAKMVTTNLSSGIGQLQIYNTDLKLLSGLVDVFEHVDFNMKEFQTNVLQPAKKGNVVKYVQNNIYYFASPIEMNNKRIGVLVINYKLDLLNLVLNKAIFILCIGAVAFCFIIIILSIFISQKIVVPIKKLVTTTDNYAKRDFTIVNISRSDELGSLSRSINDMGIQLKEHIDRQKQFISNVSHEIRTPLAAIKGYSEYLADEVLGNPDMEKAIYHLNNETVRLTSLVNDLLQVSRLDSVQENFTFSKLDFSSVLLDTIEHMRDRASNHGIEFDCNIKSNIFINGDKDKLVQVLVNVLDNCIKYSPINSRAEIKLSAENKYAALTISDQGIGIPKDDLEKIFNRFYRAANVKGITGTGLGLAISREIIEKHDGKIILNNSEKGGTEVRVILPLAH
jgi:signal transduction histidine kinase